ncbi:MAG: VOC family protein [Burkholderiales bacterium]|nr:VOC family protein [Burkholderiales bacterium]
MTRPNGIHHLAISTGDIRTQIAFFSDVLGMELVALYWMHGVKGAWHGFLKLNDYSSIALVQSPQIAAIAPQLGVSHAGTAGNPSAPGTMQHLALNVDDAAQLLTLRDRIRSRGVNVIGPIDHGFCQSIYFGGPEHLTLEISTSAEPIDPRAWIDPEVVALSGISADELARFRAPAPYAGEGGAVAQPPITSDKPHMSYPPEVYRKLIGMPDAALTAAMSQTQPPVKV